MTTKNYNLDQLTVYLDNFIKHWDSPFSIIYLRKIVELFINQISKEDEYIEKKLFKKYERRSFSLKQEAVIKEMKKIIPVADLESRIGELQKIEEAWRFLSDIAHPYPSADYDLGLIDKNTLTNKATEIVSNIRNFLLGIRVESTLPRFVKLNDRILQMVDQNPEQSYVDDMKIKLQSKEAEIEQLLLQTTELSKQHETLLKQQTAVQDLKNELTAKEIQLDSLNRKILSFNVVSKDIEKTSYSITQTWNLKLKALVKKQDFITIIFGEDNFNTFSQTKERLLGKKDEISKEVLDSWFNKQNKFDHIAANEITLPISSNFTWQSHSKASQYIQNNSNLRYIESSNSYIVFIDVKDKNYKELQINNFIFKGFMKKTYDWHLYSCWVNGLSKITPIIYNNETDDYSILNEIDLNEYKTHFLSNDKVILDFLREIIDEN